MQPLVSVIVPVYNVASYLDCCLDSIRGQSYQRLEIIMVEDCSTDDSLSLVERHLVDPRVRLLRHARNAGLSAARNTGIEAATGDYILFVDSDDVISLELVESCLAEALESKADVVLFDFVAFNDGEELPVLGQTSCSANGKFIEGNSYFQLPHFAWLKFIRGDLLKDSRLRFPLGVCYEDWPFHWELGLVTSNIRYVPVCFYQYRQRKDSITGACDQKLLDIFLAHLLIIHVAGRYNIPPRMRGVLAAKIYRGIWFVTTTIHSRLVGEAVAAAKEHLVRTRRQRRHASPGLKVGILIVVIQLPYPIATKAVRVIRIVLNKISSARRLPRRDAAP